MKSKGKKTRETLSIFETEFICLTPQFGGWLLLFFPSLLTGVSAGVGWTTTTAVSFTAWLSKWLLSMLNTN